MKKINKIKYLIAKYYKGETSIEEENILKKYFSNENVSTEFKNEKIIFENIDCQDADITSYMENFIDNISKTKNIHNYIDSYINNTINDNEIKPPEFSNNKYILKKYKSKKNKIIGIAACVIIILTISINILIHKKNINSQNISTYNGTAMTQEEVNQTVAKTLYVLSENINKVQIEYNNINRATSKTNKTINKTINNIKKIKI